MMIPYSYFSIYILMWIQIGRIESYIVQSCRGMTKMYVRPSLYTFFWNLTLKALDMKYQRLIKP